MLCQVSLAQKIQIVLCDETSVTTLLPEVTINYKQKSQAKVLLTNVAGKFTIDNPSYPITVTAEKKKYETQTISIYKNDVKEGVFYIKLRKQTSALNEVIITAQAKPILENQSIYKVTTINAKEIANRGANTLNDVLKNELNYYISNDNILGSSVNIGGVGGQNVKILVNGVPITGRENGNVDLGLINLNNVKRIETIQGPMSVLYGSNALGGVINIITNNPTPKAKASIRTYIESIGKYNINANIGFAYKKHQFVFSQARNFFKGWTPKALSDTLDRFQLWKPKTQYLTDLQYATTHKKTSIANYFNYTNEEIVNKGTPTINSFEGYAFDEYYHTIRTSNALNITRKIDSVTSLSFINSYSYYERIRNRFKKDLVTLQQIQTTGVGDQDTTRNGEINARANYNTIFKNKVSMLVGYEYNFQHLSSYKLLNQLQVQHDFGVYQSWMYTYKKLNIQPSARVSFYNNYKPQITPAIHLKYDIAKNTLLRTSYAKGYRVPSLKELYLQFIDQNHTILGNEHLLPEKSQHIELSIEHVAEYKKIPIQLKASIYRNAINNMIALAVYNNHGVLREYVNIEKYRNWTLNASAKTTYQKITTSVGVGISSITPYTNSPAHTLVEINSTLSYDINKNISINGYYKYNNTMPVIGITSGYYYTKAIHIGDVSISHLFMKRKLNAQLGVKNIFNIQQSGLSADANPTQTTGHSSSNASIFPERSGFISLGYSF